MDQTDKRICGALNRQGKPCQKPPMKGRERCLMHGGATPTGTRGNRTHGLYSQYLTPAEQERWEEVQVGVVDDELKMLRVYLARCVALDATMTAPPGADGLELSEVRQSSSDEDGMTRIDAISRRPDVMGRMNWILGRIAQLERTRADLIAAAQAAGDGADDKARDLLDVMKAMTATETDE
jgi:hypothetical protein